MRKAVATPFLLAAVALASTTADAGEPRTHDGFFLRLSGGIGYASTSISDSNNELDISDLSGDYNLAIGGIISRNLALHGTFYGWAMSDPDAEANGVSGQLNGSFSLSEMGGGVTYYLMPANVYLSGSLGLAWLSFEDAESDVGFGFDATVGKEWWVGGGWGLGLAGAFGFHSIPEKGTDASWSGVSAGLRFSATMN